MEQEDPWLYEPDFFQSTHDGRLIHDILLEEITPYLSQGTIKVMGKTHQERRMTCYFTMPREDGSVGGKMKYSGRILEPTPPPENSYLDLLMTLVASDDFREYMEEKHPRLKGIIPKFNAVFINHYRPPAETGDKPDYLGPHSDDESYLASQVILSLTYCTKNGARAFRFHGPKPSTATYKEYELQDADALFMLPGCQQKYKHSVSDKKKNKNGDLISGSRINATFRCVRD